MSTKDFCYRDLFFAVKEPQHISVKAKEALFSTEQFSKTIFYVEQGAFKVIQKIGKKELIARLATSGGLLGHRSLFHSEFYRAQAVALVESKVLAMPKVKFVKQVTECPRLALAFMKTLSKDISESEQRLQWLHNGSVRQRVAKMLLTLAETSGEFIDSQTIVIPLQLTREDLAALSSMAMENVVRTLSDFRRNNILSPNRKTIEIINWSALQMEANPF
ncbi:MAG: Crp/Fnr family transcriptional regulator [Bdellovibrionales bacterium]|nr:Crp/Fnr family transcriptional regulator [Bdellovibrionales bacterium]